MAQRPFKCSVLTPESAVLETEATFAAIPAHDGEIGVLNSRAPLLCRLGVGIVRLTTGEGDRRLFVDAGFAEVRDNHLTLLTEEALTADEIDIGEQQAAQAESRSRRARTPEEHAARARDLARATFKIKLAASGR